MASLDDIISTVKGGIQNLSQLAIIVQNALPRTIATFTLSAATTTVVTQSAIATSSLVVWTPTNAAAALTLRTQGLFLNTLVAGSSFSVSTQSGSATGTEQFTYAVYNVV